MRNVNFGILTATTTTTAETVTVTVAAPGAGKAIHVVGFDGGSSDQAYNIVFKEGATTKLTMYGAADTSVGREFGDDHPYVAADNTAVSAVVTCDTSGTCAANILYKIGY